MDARRQLARQQAELLWILAGVQTPGEGFDRAALAVTAESLRAKRARGVARCWPRLAGALGKDFEDQFGAFAFTHALPPDAQPLRDGHRFARWLRARRACPEAGLLELAAVELHWRVRRGRLERRRGPALRLVRLSETGAWVLAMRVPPLAAWWWRWGSVAGGLRTREGQRG